MATIDRAKPVRTKTYPYKVEVLRAEPEFEALKRKDPFYEFTKRTFTGNTATKGAYAPSED